MNPETNKFEELTKTRTKEEIDELYEQQRHLENMVQAMQDPAGALYRPNGEPVPKHWSIFKDGEQVVLKDYTFKVAHIGESYMVLEPVGPVIVGEKP